MIDDMGILRTTLDVAHIARPDERLHLAGVMVDTGSEYNWIPRAMLWISRGASSSLRARSRWQSRRK